MTRFSTITDFQNDSHADEMGPLPGCLACQVYIYLPISEFVPADKHLMSSQSEFDRARLFVFPRKLRHAFVSLPSMTLRTWLLKHIWLQLMA